MRPRFWFFLIAAATLCAECMNVSPVQYGGIEIVGYDGWGGQVPVEEAQLLDRDTGKVRYTARDGVFEKVSVGRYALRGHARGFNIARGEVYVPTGRARARVQLEVGVECGRAASLRGHVQPSKGRKDRWLKIAPLHGTGGTDVPIQPDGWFNVEDLNHGQHLVVVIEDGKPRHMQVVELRGDERVTITLPPV